MKRLITVLALSGLTACGGDGGPGGPTPTTTLPPPNYSGTYSGTMTLTGGGFNAVPVTATTTVTHSGSVLTFSNLMVTSPVSTSFGLGTAPLNGNAFDGTGSYQSADCGVITSRYVGHFAGNLMNLTVTLTPPRLNATCFVFDIRGELSR